MPVPAVDWAPLGSFLYNSMITTDENEDFDATGGEGSFHASGDGRADSPEQMRSPASDSTMEYEVSNEVRASQYTVIFA